MAAALLLGEAEQFGHIFAERLDSFALGKLTTVCRAFKDWARSNGRSLRLVLQHPAVSTSQVPKPHAWRPLPDGSTSELVPWVLNKYQLHIAPAFLSSYTPECDKPPVLETIYLRGEHSAVDTSATLVDLHLVHATTKEVVQKVNLEMMPISEDKKAPGKIKFRFMRLSTHFYPRAMLQLRLTIAVTLHGHDLKKTYVAYSEPMNVVSRVPTPGSLRNSLKRHPNART